MVLLESASVSRDRIGQNRRCNIFYKNNEYNNLCFLNLITAEIAQLGERQTEDLKVPGPIPGFGGMDLHLDIFT